MHSTLFVFAHLLLGFMPCFEAAGLMEHFDGIEGFLCIRSEFTRIVPQANSKIECASHCTQELQCKAFTVATTGGSVGVCRLFVFDRCSKRVRECGSCSVRGRVFVRRLDQRLRAGALCPAGYGDDLCGSKYKLYPDIQFWSPSKAKCDSEAGLVIMADVIDATEMSHVDALCNRSSTGTFLGGVQPPGSPEPAGGWIWASCGFPIDPSLWCCSEPNNNPSQNVTVSYFRTPKLCDLLDTSTEAVGVLCECVSPFD